MRTKYLLFFIYILACQKDLDITEFSSDFSDYTPELRIEALILPADSTAIIRIDKSFLITDTKLYDCRDNDFGEISLDSCNTIEGTWHGIEGTDIIADCGNWDPFLHDISRRTIFCSFFHKPFICTVNIIISFYILVYCNIY